MQAHILFAGTDGRSTCRLTARLLACVLQSWSMLYRYLGYTSKAERTKRLPEMRQYQTAQDLLVAQHTWVWERLQSVGPAVDANLTQAAWLVMTVC